jgi:arginyl-tRNA synthetase
LGPELVEQAAKLISEDNTEVEEKISGILAGDDGTEIWSLVLLAERLDEVIQQCKISAEPANLAKYTFTLAKSFSRFYQKYHIKQEQDRVRQAVLIVVTQIICRQLKTALDILGINVPTQM